MQNNVNFRAVKDCVGFPPWKQHEIGWNWLVARGSKEDCLTLVDKEFPTFLKDTVQSILLFTCQKEWGLQMIDIKTFFFQGEHIDWDALS